MTMGGGGFNPNDLESIDMRIPVIDEKLLDYKINPKAFINAHNFANLNALLDEVKRIDNDDNAYNAMRNEPLFLDNFNPREFYDKKLLEFFDNIFSQGPNLAFRRGVGQHLQGYENRIKTNTTLTKLTRDSINVAKFITFIQRKGSNKFTQKWRKFIRALKFWRKK